MHDAARHVLLVYGGHAGGRTHELVAAVAQGVTEFRDEVALRALPALEAGVADLLWANGLLIGTPEHFGYMSGAVKDFLDRTFYPAEGKVDALPYALFVSAGNDGTGAVSSIERIAVGYKWKRIADALIVKGEVTEEARRQCVELGQTMAAGLVMGVF
jgi:multimeric flavodoxin WrbA